MEFWELYYAVYSCGIIIYKTFRILNKSNNYISNYKDFLDEIYNSNNKNKFLNLSYVTNILINIFLLISLFIMISGFGAYFEQEFRVNNLIGATILSITCFIIFLTNIKGVTKISSVIVPILIFFIIFLGLYNFGDFDALNLKNNIENPNGNWLLQSVLYCSYNIILLIPVLVSLNGYIKSRKETLKISVICSSIICVLAIIIYSLLARLEISPGTIEMPVVYVIAQKFPQLKLIYGIIILSSILTTAISVGISFLNNVSKDKKSFFRNTMLMCILSILVSDFGFSNLVRILFTTFGYLGLIQIVMIIRGKW